MQEHDDDAFMRFARIEVRTHGGPLTCGNQSVQNRVANAGNLLLWLLSGALHIPSLDGCISLNLHLTRAYDVTA